MLSFQSELARLCPFSRDDWHCNVLSLIFESEQCRYSDFLIDAIWMQMEEDRIEAIITNIQCNASTIYGCYLKIVFIFIA